MPYSEPEAEMYDCRRCGQKTAQCRLWESSDGAHEDYNYQCTNPECLAEWWVEGIDS